jgi:hypothetical protein
VGTLQFVIPHQQIMVGRARIQTLGSVINSHVMYLPQSFVALSRLNLPSVRAQCWVGDTRSAVCVAGLTDIAKYVMKF